MRKKKFEPRAVKPGEMLTSQDVYDHLVYFGGVDEWARSVNQYADKIARCILAWRRSVRRVQVEQMALDLVEAGVNRNAIKFALNCSPPRKGASGQVPHVTRQEIAADAAHIAQWGHV